MAIVTTYVCDVSGVSGTNYADFVSISITADNSRIPHLNYTQRQFKVDKLVHVDVARKLNLVHLAKGEEAQPEPTLDSKLLVLLKEYIVDIAYEAGSEAGAEAASNYNRGG